MDRERCCLRANALVRFHAICCMLKKLISLAREKIRVHVEQELYCWSEEGAEALCDVARHCTTFQSRYWVKGKLKMQDRVSWLSTDLPL